MNLMLTCTSPLNYRIDSWYDLPQVLSNNSQDLHISVSDIFSGDQLSGLRITVYHEKFGPLFCELIQGKGYLVSECQENVVYSLSDAQIFMELAKYGFNVEWSSRINISPDQLNYLQIVKGLHFDKLRLLNAKEYEPSGKEISKIYVVVFQAKELPQWLNNMFVTTKEDFLDALGRGYALNLTEVSHRRNYRWDWLTYVADIQDLVDSVTKGGDLIRPLTS